MAFVINLFASTCGIVVPAILFTLFVASVVEAIEKKGKVNWKLLFVALALVGSYTWGQNTGYKKAIEEVKLIEVKVILIPLTSMEYIIPIVEITITPDNFYKP